MPNAEQLEQLIGGRLKSGDILVLTIENDFKVITENPPKLFEIVSRWTVGEVVSRWTVGEDEGCSFRLRTRRFIAGLGPVTEPENITFKSNDNFWQGVIRRENRVDINRN